MGKQVLSIFVGFLCLAIGLFAFNIDTCHADEWRCTAAYSKAVVAAENAAIAAEAGNACGAADGIEAALNWIGTAESECSEDENKLKEVLVFKYKLIPLLAKYVGLCGH